MPETYLHVLYPNLKPQIDEALAAGYSFQETHDHISAKINEAKRSGYNDDEVTEYTGATIDLKKPQSYFDFISMGYRAFGTLNEGTAGVIQKLPEIGQYVSGKLGFGRSDIVDKAAKAAVDQLMTNKEYWEQRAKERGVSFIDELMGDAVGGFIPWVAEWKMGVPYFAAQGAIEAKSKGQNEYFGAFKGALERAILGKLFHTYGMLKKPLAAVATGGTFAIQTWMKGGDIKEAEKAFLTGILYSLGGKGRIGIKEIRDMHSGEKRYELSVRDDIDIEKSHMEDNNEQLKSMEEGESRRAIITKDDKMYIGGKSDIHATVRPDIDPADIKTTGFVDKEGKFTEKPVEVPPAEEIYYSGRRGMGPMKRGSLFLTPDKEYAARYGDVTEYTIHPKKMLNLTELPVGRQVGFNKLREILEREGIKIPDEMVDALDLTADTHPIWEWFTWRWGSSKALEEKGFDRNLDLIKFARGAGYDSVKWMERSTETEKGIHEAIMLFDKSQATKAAEAKPPAEGTYEQFIAKDVGAAAVREEPLITARDLGRQRRGIMTSFGAAPTTVEIFPEMIKRFQFPEYAKDLTYEQKLQWVKDHERAHAAIDYMGDRSDKHTVELWNKLIAAWKADGESIGKEKDVDFSEAVANAYSKVELFPDMIKEQQPHMFDVLSNKDVMKKFENRVRKFEAKEVAGRREDVGAAAARKETRLYGTLLEQQKAAEADVDKLRNLAVTKPREVFMKGNVEALEQYAQRVDREIFVDKMKKLHPLDENSIWLQEGYEDAGDFWDRNAAPSKEITKDIYDRNWSKVGVIAEDIDKQIDRMANTAEKMSRAAFDAGDKEGAIREHERMMEIRRNKEVIKKEHDRLKKEVKSITANITALSKQKNMDPDYRDHILSILEDYDLHVRSKKMLGERQDTRDFIKRQEEAGETVYIPQSKLDMLRKRPLNDVTIEELRNLEEIIESLAHQGILKNKLVIAGKKRDFAEAKKDLLDSMKTNMNNFKEPEDVTGKFPSEREPAGFMARFKRKIGQLHGATKVEYILDRLDGFKGRMYEVKGKWAEVFQSRVEAENQELKLKEADVKALKQAVDPIRDKFRSMASDKEEIAGRSITRMEAISVYWNSKNPGNRKALEKGYGLSDADIDTIVASLKPHEIKFANDIMAIIQGKGPMIAEVLKSLTGEKMRFEKDYFPLWFDWELSDKAVQRQQEVDLMKQMYDKVSVGRKFTIQRVGGTEAPYLSFDVAVKHLDRVNHFIANARAVRDFQKLIFDKDIKRTIEANAGEGAHREMMEWLKDWANPRQGYVGTIDKYFGILRHNTTLVSLGCKASTMILQPTAYAQLINRIGFSNAMAGLMDFYRNPAKNWQIIKDLSPTMATRMHSFDRDIQDFLDKDPYFSKYGKLKEAAMYGISICDLATTAPAWWSSYNLGMKKFGWNQKQAVEYADRIVRTTQASGLQKDLPGVLRGSNFKKAFAMFYTYFSSTYNEAARDVRAVREGEQSIPSLMRTFMWLFVIPAVIETIFKKREDFTVGEYGKNLIVNMGTSIPYAGPIINAATTGFDYQASPTFELPKEIVLTFQAKEPEKKLKHAVMATGYLTGFPSRQAILTTQYLGDALAGRSYDPTNIIYRKKKKKGGWE